MIIELFVVFLSFLTLTFVMFFVLPYLYGAPFEPTDRKELRKIIEFSKIKKGEKVVDLGSGNGKIVIAFAKKGFEAHGFELNPFLVIYSRMKIKRLGLQDKAFIHFGDFWNYNMKYFDIVTTFQIGYIMARLERKLKKELRKGSRIISNTWKFPNLKIKKKEGDVYLYSV